MKILKTALALVALSASGVAMADGPSPSQDALYRALSARDGAPSCVELAALTETPLVDLLYVVENARRPAYVSMRAADCVVQEHAQAAAPVIQAWVTEPNMRGLAILTFNRLDLMPAVVAQDIAQRGLAGPYASDARDRILRSENADIRALVTD